MKVEEEEKEEEISVVVEKPCEAVVVGTPESISEVPSPRKPPTQFKVESPLSSKKVEVEK